MPPPTMTASACASPSSRGYVRAAPSSQRLIGPIEGVFHLGRGPVSHQWVVSACVRGALAFVSPVMTMRGTARIVACVALGAIAACSTSVSQPERTFKPNELQVIEPSGQEASWTYAPALLKVSKGSIVTIVNRGKEFHTVTSDDPGRLFDISIDANTTV